MPDDLSTIQYAFTAHIRNPSGQPAPADIEDRRMKIYRDLAFGNINRLLSSAFPVLRRLYPKMAWRRMVREFYSEHLCHTPLFPELPREFLRYIQEQRTDREGDPAFLLELAHYEWVELALSIDEAELDKAAAEREGDLLEGIPVLSPLAWPLTYRFPVHRIKPDFMPTEPPENPTQLLAYRDRSDRVKFMQLNDITQLLLTLLRDEENCTGRQHLEKLAQLMEHPHPERLIESGHQLLLDFLKKDIVLGCAPQ